MRWLCALLLMARAAWAEPEIYQFTWQGNGDHVLNGALMLDPAQAGAPVVTEEAVQCFWIEGRRGATVLGSWGLGQRTAATTWTLTLDRRVPEFLVYPDRDGMPQAWNMNGWGENCGAPGFGFNIGSAAQDICVDGRLIVESQVPPSTPFLVRRIDSFDFPPGSCSAPLLLGALR